MKKLISSTLATLVFVSSTSIILMSEVQAYPMCYPVLTWHCV